MCSPALVSRQIAQDSCEQPALAGPRRHPFRAPQKRRSAMVCSAVATAARWCCSVNERMQPCMHARLVRAYTHTQLVLFHGCWLSTSCTTFPFRECLYRDTLPAGPCGHRARAPLCTRRTAHAHAVQVGVGEVHRVLFSKQTKKTCIPCHRRFSPTYLPSFQYAQMLLTVLPRAEGEEAPLHLGPKTTGSWHVTESYLGAPAQRRSA